MLFSVIIPAFNAEETIENTVNCILYAGLKDYEILIIDDGSTDGTGHMCDRLAAKHSGVKCIHKANSGVSSARNTGVMNSKGDYIIFVDADDYIEQDSLSNAVDIIEAQHPDMLIFGMYFDYYYRNSAYRSDSLVPPCSGMLTLEQVKMKFSELYAANALTPVWNKFFSRKVIIDNHVLFCETMILFEDFMFTIETLEKCNKVYCLQEPIYHYRQSEDEKNAYRRLCRIGNLSEYLSPFSEQIESLGIANGKAFMSSLYKMLLNQHLYYSSYNEIHKLINQHLSGEYSDVSIEKRPLVIYLQNKKSQLRHKIAVILKSLIHRIKRTPTKGLSHE